MEYFGVKRNEDFSGRHEERHSLFLITLGSARTALATSGNLASMAGPRGRGLDGLFGSAKIQLMMSRQQAKPMDRPTILMADSRLY
jgi:hypothetical protein